ncbi:ammonium transporter [Roseospira marina]|uniref:Ammonium transporter n=1 Tax=Roseospira marina TaxID=140057 RepID=A0A5M6IH24_9PROT|nr:ammonium transporter [Roseospira marina]KAA5607207.1 ammonium transporter [Roseospira marina]MBB4312643.1 Amt family ammonium transporter [Roseospira marina]MBB5085341.1 Amt family ammonium transporter [Roseospira marina]
MIRSKTQVALAALGGLAAVAMAGPALAQEAAEAAMPAVSGETVYIFNTLSFMLHGFLVMFMAAGFGMLEGGLVRSKNTTMQMLKNIAIYSIGGLMFWVIGYNLMYNDVASTGGLFGIPGPWGADDPLTADGAFTGDGGYAGASDWFFQMVFVATAASIVSGTLAERIKLWPFMIFVVVLTGVIYPIQGAWQWGGGWLSEAGFSDFAGSSIVHSTGGWAALSGAILLGARIGKFGPDGKVNPMPGANLPLATLGTFILWLGWFGFNGGSQLAMGSAADVTAISTIYVNTNLAAAAGVTIAMIMTQAMYGKVDLTMALNGALAGLVSITAEPLTPSPIMAILIGGIGGVLVVIAVPLLDKLKIDDVVGAIPVHLVCGIWGTMAVPLTNSDTNFGSQALGVVSIGAFVFVVSFVIWSILKMTMGIRVSEEEEAIGLDKAELGLEAYPEFGRGSQAI